MIFYNDMNDHCRHIDVKKQSSTCLGQILPQNQMK